MPVLQAERRVRISLLPGQARFDALREKQGKKYRLYVGGVGAGKTWIGAFTAAQCAARNESGVIVAPSYRMLQDVTIPEFLDAMDLLGVGYTYQKAHERLKLYQGGYVFFRSGMDPNKLRGPNLTWAWLDEGALLPEKTWEVILGRIRIGDTQAWVTTTPAGFNWLWDLWEESPGEKFGMVRASSRDNHHLAEDFVEDLEASYSASFAKQEIEGHFIQFEGLVYPNFSESVNVVDPFPIPKSWRIYRAIDFGFTNPFVCLWIAVDHDDRMYVIDEHYQSRLLIKEHAEIIKAFDLEPGARITATVADHDAQEVAELAACGIPSIPALKEVKVGVQTLSARLDVQPDGKPRYFVFRNCVQHRKEFTQYHYPTRERKGMDRSAYENPVKEADHTMDPARYVAMLLRHSRDTIRTPSKGRKQPRPLTAGYRNRQF